MALVNPNIALSVQQFQVPNMLGMAAEAEGIQNMQVNRQAALQEMDRAQYSHAIAQSKEALRFVQTPDQYLAWMDSSFNDPVIGGMLKQMGVDPAQARSQVMTELQQPGGLERAIQRSAASVAELGDIMGQRVNAMEAQRKATAGQAQNAAQQAQIDAVLGRAAPSAQATPSAQAFPIAAPTDTAVYAPGTPGAINQLYSQVGAQPSPTLNALTTQPSTSADPRMAQLIELDNLAMQGNARAAQAAKILRDQIKFGQEISPTQDPTKRYINVGEGVVFDTQTQQYIQNPERRPRAGTPLPVVQPDGSVVYVSPEEAIGKTPGSQAPTAAERAKQEKAEKGVEGVDKILDQLQGYYAELNTLGGVPSTARSPAGNIAAFTAATVPFAGRAIGSKEQKIRDQITQIRSALVREIKNATGMSAQELNSNVELQLALEAATDPTISFEANLETLRNLSNLYGSGKLAGGTSGAAPAAGGSDIDALLEKYK